jgi:hypothetical protein
MPKSSLANKRRGGRGTLARMASNAGLAIVKTYWPDRPPEKDGTVLPPGPISAQRYFVDCDLLPHEYRWFNGGIGSGKTVAGGMFCARYGLEHPNQCAIIAGMSGPSLKRTAVKVFLRILDNIQSKNGIPGLYSHNKQEQTIKLFNGFTYYYLGMEDADKALGISCSLVWCDEINTWNRPVYSLNILKERKREASRDGRTYFIVTCSPRGRRGAILRWATGCKHEIAPGVMVGKGGTANHLFVTMRTQDNVTLPKSFIKELELSFDPKLREQQLEAKLVDMGTGVFADVFKEEPWPIGNILYGFRFDKAKHELYIGIDWGDNYPHVLFVAHNPNAEEDEWTDCVFDEICRDGMREAKMFAEIRRKLDALGLSRPRWFIPDKKGVAQITALKGAFPGCQVRTVRDDTVEESTEYGTYILRGRLLNGGEVRRLVLTEGLCLQPQNRNMSGRGILRGLLEIDYPRDRDGHIRAESPKDESWLIHGIDTLRYVEQVLHPVTRGRGYIV